MLTKASITCPRVSQPIEPGVPTTGKRERRSDGAWLAANVVQAPTFYTNAQSRLIKVFILRIRDVETMVDTGAKNSIISEEISQERSAFKIRSSESTWCLVNR